MASAQIGFHAQQAVEKAMKEVLAGNGVDYPWTHDLQSLITSLSKAGIQGQTSSPNPEDCRPGPSSFVYGETIDEEIDREAVQLLVDGVIEWADSAVF